MMIRYTKLMKKFYLHHNLYISNVAISNMSLISYITVEDHYK